MGTLNIGRVRIGWKGAYSAATVYNPLDAVTYNGSSYVCILTTTAGIAPTNTTYWQLMAQAGADGANGADGADGAQGPIGPTGATGATGPQGPQGDQGIQGPQGVAGPEGPQGDTGAAPEHAWLGTQLRFRNPDGTWAAYTDLIGPQGNQGPQGVQGIQGDQGVKGDTGAQGPQGPQGPIGPEGPTGPQGPAGADGHNFATGSNVTAYSTSGTVGDIYYHTNGQVYQVTGPSTFVSVGNWQGADGADGADGATGATGPQGPTGTTGPQGPAGPAGADGSFPVLAAGTIIRSRYDGAGGGTSSYVTRMNWYLLQKGIVTIYFQMRSTIGGYSARAEVRRVRNGTDTLMQAFTSSSTSYTGKQVDVSVLPGDRIYIRVKGGSQITAAGKGQTITYWTGQTRFNRLQTDGTDFYPGSGAANSEGW